MGGGDLAAFAASMSSGLDWKEAIRRNALQIRKVFLERSSLSCESEMDLLRSNRSALISSGSTTTLSKFIRQPTHAPPMP